MKTLVIAIVGVLMIFIFFGVALGMTTELIHLFERLDALQS